MILSNLGAENDESIRKRTAQMVQIMIILVLISYVPFIIWWQYYNVITIQRGPSVEICTRIFRLHCSIPKVNTSEVRNSIIISNDFLKRYILFLNIYLLFVGHRRRDMQMFTDIEFMRQSLYLCMDYSRVQENISGFLF